MANGLLDVGDGHQLYFETWGNPAGVPVVVLHGGPGSGCSPRLCELYDERRHQVVFFDQRGCPPPPLETIHLPSPLGNGRT